MMKKQNLITLTVITVVVIMTALYLSQQSAPRRAKETAVLFPALKEKINRIDSISIEDADTHIVIHKQEGIWTIEQLDNYPASFDKVKQTVVAVSELDILARKTTNPQLYARLGVTDIDEKGAVSQRLTLYSADQAVASLIIGQSRRSKSPGNKPGLYVRLPDSDQALLVAGNVAVTAKAADWFDRDILDIKGSDVKHISLQPEGQATVSLMRENEGGKLSLENIPADKEAQAEAIINRTGTLLEGLFAESVKRDIHLQDATKVSTFSVTTFTDLLVNGQLVKQGDEHYVFFSVAADATATTNNTDEETANDGVDIVAQAELINQRLAGWAYLVPQHKIELFAKTLDDLTKNKNSLKE